MIRLTPEQAAIVTASTGRYMGDFDEFHAYAEGLLGRPILTSEFACGELWDQLHAKAQADMARIACTREQQDQS